MLNEGGVDKIEGYAVEEIFFVVIDDAVHEVS